jgi:predicted dithiol-disulfide oxidoreductase (DUF899 family)
VRLSELFRGGDTLMLYHYMFPRHVADKRPGPTRGAMVAVPLAEGPCPSCTALIDLSAADSSFKRDYHGEDANGQQVPILTVFKRSPDGTIRLHWASELVFEPSDPGQDVRHLGRVEPLWTLFDLTPGGRPAGDERLEYDCCDWNAARWISVAGGAGMSIRNRRVRRGPGSAGVAASLRTWSCRTSRFAHSWCLRFFPPGRASTEALDHGLSS